MRRDLGHGRPDSSLLSSLRHSLGLHCLDPLSHLMAHPARRGRSSGQGTHLPPRRCECTHGLRCGSVRCGRGWSLAHSAYGRGVLQRREQACSEVGDESSHGSSVDISCSRSRPHGVSAAPFTLAPVLLTFDSASRSTSDWSPPIRRFWVFPCIRSRRWMICHIVIRSFPTTRRIDPDDLLEIRPDEV